MNNRDRLADIIDSFFGCDSAYFDVDKYEFADHLLANGVIVPPCKVGDTVWFIRKDYKVEIIETAVEKVILKHGGLYIKLCCNSMYETTCNSIGKTVFLTKEEAEQALKERDTK